MKRLVAYSLLLLYVNSYTELHEALRLPLLIEHYAEHRQKVSDMSFWEFLVMHYKTDVAHDDQDDTLPFKDLCHCCCTPPAMTVPLQKITLLGSVPLSEINHASSYKEAIVVSPLSDIFQPPRAS